MKKILSLLTFCLIAICGWAGTITFGDLDLENGVQYLDPFDGGDFTVTFAGGANDGKYYTTGAGIRVYGGGTMTVAAKTGNLTEVTVTYDGSNKPTSADVVNVGTYDVSTGVWTGSSNSVVFTRPSGSGHWRVKSVTAVIDGVVMETVKTPTFDPEGGEITETTEVEISCETQNATILYSFNQTDWNEYENPIEVSVTTTIYAKATKEGMNDSQIASATYTLVDPSLSHAMFDFDNDYATLFGIDEFTTGEYDFEETQTISKDDIQMSISTSTTNTPNRLWYNSPRLRMYGGTMTITAAEGYVITALTINQGKWNDGNTVNIGTLTNNSWTGNASELTITIAGNTQFKSIDVTYKQGQGDEPPTPQVDEISTIADFIALENNKQFKYTGDLICVQDYSHENSNGNIDRYLYLADATGGIIVYNPDANTPLYETSDIVPGGWSAKKTTYKNLIEATNATDFVEKTGSQNIEPITMTIDEANQSTSYGSWIVIKNVLIRQHVTTSLREETGIPTNSSNLYITEDGQNELAVYGGHTSPFNLPTDWETDERYDVVGVLGVYGQTQQLLPTGIAKNGEIITGTTEIIETSVKNVLYYNMQGISCEKPFEGVNIVVTEYSDGNKKITKQIYKF